MGQTQDIGNKGEAAAVNWLLSKGFEICHRNWRNGHYELDVVAAKNGIIHFIEVKCRKKGGLTSPEDAITPAKFHALEKAAEAYIMEYGIESEVQFDLISVEYSADRCHVRYIPNAMIARW